MAVYMRNRDHDDVRIGMVDELTAMAPRNDGQDVYRETMDHELMYAGHLTDFALLPEVARLPAERPSGAYYGLTMNRDRYVLQVCVQTGMVGGDYF